MHSLVEDRSHMVQVSIDRIHIDSFIHHADLYISIIPYSTDESQRVELLPGDHALIPAFVEHQEVSQAYA